MLNTIDLNAIDSFLKTCKKEIKKKYVKLNQQQYVILVNAGMAKECVSIHDYYIVDRDLAMTCNVEVKEALLSDILSYMRKRSED